MNSNYRITITNQERDILFSKAYPIGLPLHNPSSVMSYIMETYDLISDLQAVGINLSDNNLKVQVYKETELETEDPKELLLEIQKETIYNLIDTTSILRGILGELQRIGFKYQSIKDIPSEIKDYLLQLISNYL